jgi:phospholipid transport system transporter-binding protein
MKATTALLLPQELTHERAQDWLQSLTITLHQVEGPQVTVDASRLTHFDSSALAVLLACRREAMSAKKTLKVIHLPDQLRQLAMVYGVAELVQSTDNVH